MIRWSRWCLLVFCLDLVPPVHSALPSFANTNPIAIPSLGQSTPYPSTISVSNVAGTVRNVSVVLSNLSHSFPDNLDVLVTGPAGQDVLLMSDAGGSANVNGVTLTVAVGKASLLPDNTQIVSGTYRPSNYVGAVDTFLAPAPAPPYGSSLSVFNGANPNGVWRLFVMDNASSDSGTMAGGWRLVIDDTPLNDDFDNSAVLNGTNIISANGSNAGATKEIGEPNHSGNVGGKSVWWSWTAPASGPVAIDTRGSSFDTVLGVYTGSSVSNLTVVAANNNSGGNLSSRVAFNTQAGTTYQIAVDGFNGAFGDVTLNSWIPIHTNTGSGGPAEFLDRSAINYGRRFYRAVLEP